MRRDEYTNRQCEHDYPHAGHRVWGRLGGTAETTYCPGIKVKRSSRLYPVKTRSNVVHDLRLFVTMVRQSVWRWNVDGTIGFGTSDERPRRIEEYPENDRAAWVRLADDMAQLANNVSALQRYALAHVAAIDQSRILRERASSIEL